MLDLTGECIVRENDTVFEDSGDSNPHQKNSSVNKEDSAEEIEKSQRPLRQSALARRTLICFHDTEEIVAIENLVTNAKH